MHLTRSGVGCADSNLGRAGCGTTGQLFKIADMNTGKKGPDGPDFSGGAMPGLQRRRYRLQW